MDPLFGLTAVRDSRAMDTARQRNRSQQQALQQHIAHLDDQCSWKKSKINSDAKELNKTLYSSADGIVLPRGMSYDQKDKYRQLRRGSLPSMTLEEFDNRMEEIRKARDNSRDNLATTRKPLRKNEKRKSSVKENPTVQIVPEPPKSLATRRSSLLKAVLERANSVESSKFSDGLQLPAIGNWERSPGVSSRRSSSIVSPIAASVTATKNSQRSFSPHKSSSSPITQMVRRRATMPDIRAIDLKSDEEKYKINSALAKFGDIIGNWHPEVKVSDDADSLE